MSLLIPGTNSIKATGYDVDNSLRTNKPDAPRGEVTQGTPTNADKYTFSVWVKRADVGASNSKIFSVANGSYGEEKLEFNTDDIIWRQTAASDGNTVWQRVTNRVFRDESAWYNIIVAYDSSQGTAGDRCKMYINGVEETSFSGSSDPSSNLDSYTNTSGAAFKFFTYHENSNTTQDASAYFAEMVYIDGQQLDQTSFGQFDSSSPNVWVPKDVSGLTFGSNGFYLEFKNSGSLGTDTSGNSNNLTLTNISATNQSTDTCTNNGCTLNRLASSTTPIFTNGNLTIKGNGNNSSNQGCPATFVLSKGKWYWEMKNESSNHANYIIPGFVNANYYANLIAANGLPGNYYDASNGFTNNVQGGGDNNNYVIHRAGSSNTTVSGGLLQNQIYSFALDLDNRKCWFRREGAYYNSGDPAAGSNETWGTSDIDADTPYSPVVFHYYTASQGSFNFGSPAFSITSGNSDANGYGNFEYSVPSGFYAINSKNLAEFG